MRGGYARFALAWLLCASVLAVRSWPVLQGPYLFAEDGAIFFADAWNLSLPAALTTPYAGYYHLLPRLIAGAAALLPSTSTPWVYALAAIAINATAISWLQLPHYRLLIRNDWLRLGIVLLLALAPNWEALSTISYLQWGLAWWAVLLTLMPLDNRLLRLAVTVVYVVAIWTAPILLLLFPIWLLRLWRTRSRADALMVALFIAAHLGYIAATLQAPRDVAAPVDWAASLEDFVRAYAYRVTGAGFLGDVLAEMIHVQYGWPLLLGWSAAVTALLLAALIYLHPLQRTLAVAVLLYAGIASLSFYLLRSTNMHLPFFLDETPLVYTHRRYFLLASAAIFVLIGMMLDGLPARLGRNAAWRIWVMTILLLALLPLPSLVEPPVTGEPWPLYGRLLDAWRGLNAAEQPAITMVSGDPRQVNAVSWQPAPRLVFLPLIMGKSAPALAGIPIAPHGWLSKLTVPAPALPFAGAGQNLLFAGALVQNAAGGLEANLAWQYAGSAGEGPGRWWASLWLMDGSGGALACQPLDVAVPNPWMQPGQLFFTQAVMPLPGGARQPDWRLAVSSSPCSPTVPIIVPAP